MSSFENNDNEEIEDTPTNEEQQKIEVIQISTFIAPKKEETKPFSLWSIFGFGSDEEKKVNANGISEIESVIGAAGALATQSAILKLDLAKFLYLEKSVIINNISGKNAYVLLSPAPIKTIKSVGISGGVAGIEGSIDISMEDKGEYKIQKISIANNTSSKCDLDNTKFYCTLFFDVDGQWKKSWDNRRFNGRKYNLNILEKHVLSALDKNNIPNF